MAKEIKRMVSSKNKPKPKTYTDKERLKAGFHGGYDIRWLREIPEHPDYHFVAEYDTLMEKSEKESK